MLPGERRNRIIDLVNKNNSITVAMLCETLNASEATIRRDLTTLESDGKLERTHGGAISTNAITLEYEETFLQKELQFASEKKSIAMKAFELIKDHDSILLDAGTTTLEIAKLIGQSQLRLTVVTNSTILSQAISYNDKVELYVVGGKVRLNTLATVGNTAIDMIKRFCVNKVFIGINGITISNGLTTPDLEEAEMKRAMLESGITRYVLADHTKFDKVALCQVAPLSMIDGIITDNALAQDQAAAFEKNDITVILADL